MAPETGGTSQAKQRLSSTVNAPVEFGDGQYAGAMETLTVDSSPYGRTFVNNGAAGTVTGVFGSAYSSTSDSYLSTTSVTAIGTGWVTYGLWIKTESLTEPAAEYLIASDDDAGGTGEYVALYAAVSGLNANRYDGSTINSAQCSAINFYDQQWHHVALVSGTLITKIYADGVLCASDTATPVTGSIDNDKITIGSSETGGNTFNGLIDDVFISYVEVSDEAIAKIYAEGRKQLNRGNPFAGNNPAGALISNRVYDLDALDNGIWAVSFSDANTVQIFDGRIEIQQIFTSGGSPAIALVQNAGADSVGIVIATKTQTQIIQPDVNLEKMASSSLYHKEPILIGETVVVDSSGGGHFWTVDDAVDAAANGNRSNILITSGTYGPFDADQHGQTISGSGWGVGSLSPSSVIIDGGTTDDAVEVTANNVTLRGLSVKTTAGGGNSFHGIRASSGASKFIIQYNYIIGSDAIGISLEDGGQNFGLLEGNYILNSDGNCIDVGQGYNRIIANTCYGGGGGILLYNSADGSTVVGNIVGNANTITLNAGADNNAVVGNTTDNSGVSNSGTGNSVTGNAVF
jgi:hypothetical protein